MKFDSRTPPSQGDAAAEHEPGSKDRPFAVQVGVRVRVLEGGLRGQIGVVTELDDRQGIRVQVGALAVWLRDSEILAIGSERDRPVLRTSHRRDTKRGPSDP